MTEVLLFSLGLSLAINIAMFLVAFRLQSDKLTDISYAVTFITLGLFGFVRSEQELYHLVLFAMILIWGVRIGGFLLYRVIKNGKDARFDDMRDKFFLFGRFWVLQAITVWVLLIPSLFAFDNSGSSSLLVSLGVTVWLVGLVVESIADLQKYRFSQNPKNKGQWIEEGIWYYSRHPNYFGEIVVWVGVYLYVVTALSQGQALVGLVSPIFITTLLLFVSGIPLLEKSADKRWGSQKEYQRYKSSTSVLVPLPKKR